MRALILLHRWLGVAFCLLFAMWFATGIVMHFVPFPALTETERFAGLAPIALASVKQSPAEARAASGMTDATRIRLVQRSDGPVYLIADGERAAALRAADLSDAAVHSQDLALAIARDYARSRGWSGAAAEFATLNLYDQWTVPAGFDRYRPLYRVALNDGPGTELYVSAVTGEVALVTTHRVRAWNYVGSIAHWIYPRVLRSHPATWSRLLWWLSLLALIGAGAGAAIGMLRLGGDGTRLSSPYRGWQAWHHWLGLCCMVFVLSWIFSGWFSMDSGDLFSTGKPTDAEAASIAGMPAWNALSPDEIRRLSAPVREVEWFAFGDRIYRRERASGDRQLLSVVGAADEAARADLRRDEIDATVSHLARSCDTSEIVRDDDDYAVASDTPGAPVFRAVCGADWFDIDGANGALLEKLDASRRVYRWLYGALHTLDFPVLTARPVLRTSLIVALCGLGFVFSLTGVMIAWRRLMSCFRSP
jgi:PepSY-associated TM region